MSDQGLLRRPLLLASAGIAAAAIIFIALYSDQSHPTPSTNLHRSNAVRERNRRWRPGRARRDLNDDSAVEALRRLAGRIQTRQAYGRYENRMLLGRNQELLESGRFDLLPQNLGPIYRELCAMREMTEHEKLALNNHVESIFVQNFLREEFHPGYIIGEEVETLVNELHNHGINEVIIRTMVDRFDAGKPLTPVDWDLHDGYEPPTDVPQADGGDEEVTAQAAIETLRGINTNDLDPRSSGVDNDSDPGGSQGMLDLLYHIAAEQAKREGFIHRGVECNSCGAQPIRGIRYHCANCFDYDLCETCEAQQVHIKSHVFFKIRIPAPSRGQIKEVTPVWYPGQPNQFPSSMSPEMSKILCETYRIEKTELESYYEQFKCLAGHSIPLSQDPTRLGVAIDRKGFDLYFTTGGMERMPQNLLYDRIFAYYDYNYDDVITFDEFVRGMTDLQNRTRAARVKRMFQGYDLDGDGYVDRKDFLRIFRAYYAWHKELNREIVNNQVDMDEDLHDAVHNSHPISQAFGWSEFAGHASRGGQDKEIRQNGDLAIVEGPTGVLQNDVDNRGDRSTAIANAALHGMSRSSGFRSFRTNPEVDEPIMSQQTNYWDIGPIIHREDATDEEMASADRPIQVYGWPPFPYPQREDIMNAVGANLPIEEILDPVDRARVVYAQAERLDDESEKLLNEHKNEFIRRRWQRRQFYLDEEEGMTKPPGYTEPDSSDDEENVEVIDEEPLPATLLSSRRQSMRSRSSSKVRFDDSAIDTDYETRSNTSSRSVPVNERWGGFELSEAEKDIGKEILYQAVQQGFNEILDPLFKEKEDEAMAALKTKASRIKWKAEIDAYEEGIQKKAEKKEAALYDADMERTKALMAEFALSEPETNLPSSKDENNDTVVDNSTPDNIDTPSLQATDQTPDFTLPQFRPNEPFTALPHTTSTPSEPLECESPPAEKTLELWLKHRSIDLESVVRGGYGKLSLSEFKKKMVQESINGIDMNNSKNNNNNHHRSSGHRNVNTNGSNDNNNNDNNNNDMDVNLNTDIGEEDIDEEERTWNSTADLGKLSFLGSWLEMAQF